MFINAGRYVSTNRDCGMFSFGSKGNFGTPTTA